MTKSSADAPVWGGKTEGQMIETERAAAEEVRKNAAPAPPKDAAAAIEGQRYTAAGYAVDLCKIGAGDPGRFREYFDAVFDALQGKPAPGKPAEGDTP